MDVYTTEEEQIEKIKEWLKSYGPTIIITIVVVFAASYGWRYWQAREAKISAQASVSYEQMLISFTNNDAIDGKLQANNLIKQFPRTPYAKFAAFALAKNAVKDNDYQAASKQLQWVIDNAQQAATKQVARNRLARIYVAQNKATAALKLLQTQDDKSLLAVTDSIKGDAYKALGEKTKAKSAYQQALKAMPKEDANYSLLQMKLDDLA